MMRSWYVLRVMTGKEAAVAKKINGGMEAAHRDAFALVPIRVLNEWKNGIKREVRRTVFPGYVFVRTNMTADRYYTMQAIPHAIRFLKEDHGAPAPIPEEQMAVVLILANGGREFGISHGARIGGTTCIRDGPLKRLASRIVRVDAHRGRATVAIPLLNETKEIDLGIELTDSFAPASADSSPCMATSD